MNSNTNNSEKINNLTEQDEVFFAQHPQPTLEQARAMQAAFQEEDDEEEDLLSIMSDVEIDEDYDEDEGMFNCCDDDCCCFRCIAQDPLSRAPQICFVPDGEELVGDVDLEAEDQALYDLKRYNCSHDEFVPNKSLKTYHEHDPIPMDISDDEYIEQDEDQDEEEDDCEFLCRHGTNCANQVCYDCVQALKEENSDSDHICDHGIDRINEVCYDCIWYLEQEELHGRRRPVAAANEEKEDQEWPVNVIIDDVDENVRPQLKYQRQTSCWEQNGEIVYNGNPDGSRLFCDLEDDCVCDLEDEDLTDLPDLLTEEEVAADEAQAQALAVAAVRAETLTQDLEHNLFDDYRENLYELDYLLNVLNSGETLDRWEAEKVIKLRSDIAYYEARH